MAIAVQKISEKEKIFALEHHFNKKLRAYERSNNIFGWIFLFEDGTEGELGEGEEISAMRWRQTPRSFCASCGEKLHVGNIDWLGRCEYSVARFWNKARKVFWHRYLKERLKV
jgi:hypothetical protein